MPQYELRSFKAPLLRGHAPIPLDPLEKQITVQVEVGTYYDESRGRIYEPAPQSVPGDVSRFSKENVMGEAERLFSNPLCWHITINEYAKDEGGKELRSPAHWCADVDQVEAYLNE